MNSFCICDGLVVTVDLEGWLSPQRCKCLGPRDRDGPQLHLSIPFSVWGHPRLQVSVECNICELQCELVVHRWGILPTALVFFGSTSGFASSLNFVGHATLSTFVVGETDECSFYCIDEDGKSNSVPQRGIHGTDGKPKRVTGICLDLTFVWLP